MAKFLIDFHKGNANPGEQSTEFHGRLVIDAEDSRSATKEFLEWVQAREEFETVTRFSFNVDKLDIVTGEEKIEY